jgi:hypothetical protein
LLTLLLLLLLLLLEAEALQQREKLSSSSKVAAARGSYGPGHRCHRSLGKSCGPWLRSPVSDDNFMFAVVVHVIVGFGGCVASVGLEPRVGCAASQVETSRGCSMAVFCVEMCWGVCQETASAPG